MTQIVHIFFAYALSWDNWPIHQYKPPISFCSIGMRTLAADLFDLQAFMAALSCDFGIGCSFGFGFWGSFLAAVRHALRSFAISSQCLLLISAAWRCRFLQSTQCKCRLPTFRFACHSSPYRTALGRRSSFIHATWPVQVSCLLRSIARACTRVVQINIPCVGVRVRVCLCTCETAYPCICTHVYLHICAPVLVQTSGSFDLLSRYEICFEKTQIRENITSQL